MRSVYSFAKEPVGETLLSLLQAGSRHCPFFSLSLRQFHEGREPENVLRLLLPFEISRSTTTGWPGTSPCAGTLLLYSLNRNSAAQLASMNRRLYCWCGYGYPEDLCLYRPDGTCWLGSVAHEEFGFLVLSQEELVGLRDAVPGIELEAADAELTAGVATTNWLVHAVR